MLCAVTIRNLKPGCFEAFQRDWVPQPWPPQLTRVVVSRNEQDPDQVLTASYIDLPVERFDELRDQPELLGAEDERLARISAHEDAVVYKGIFEVVEELTAPGAAA